MLASEDPDATLRSLASNATHATPRSCVPRILDTGSCNDEVAVVAEALCIGGRVHARTERSPLPDTMTPGSPGFNDDANAIELTAASWRPISTISPGAGPPDVLFAVGCTWTFHNLMVQSLLYMRLYK